MKHCPECGAELTKDDVYCVKCGTKVVSDSEKLDHQDDLQQQVNNLQQQLRRQKQNNSVNVFARLAFTRKHLLQVLTFMENNALTLFIGFILMVIPWPSNVFRVIIFLAYLIAIYFYPLLSNQERFKWDRMLEKWLNDENNIKNIKSSARNVVEHVKSDMDKMRDEREQKKQMIEEKNANERPQVSRKNDEKEVDSTTKSVPVGELICGVLLAFVGGYMYNVGKSNITSLTSQLTSVIQNGELDSSGYMYIWGAVMLGIGILAVIGGLLKAVLKKHNGGNVMKALAVIIAVIAGGIATYVYSNPVTSAVGVAESGFTLSDIGAILNIIKMIPWVVGLFYVIGIIINMSSRD